MAGNEWQGKEVAQHEEQGGSQFCLHSAALRGGGWVSGMGDLRWNGKWGLEWGRMWAWGGIGDGES